MCICAPTNTSAIIIRFFRRKKIILNLSLKTGSTVNQGTGLEVGRAVQNAPAAPSRFEWIVQLSSSLILQKLLKISVKRTQMRR